MNWGADFGRNSVFALDEDQPRARKYMFYFWHRDEWTNDFTQPIFEYTIEGSHFETDWKQTAVYPSEKDFGSTEARKSQDTLAILEW